MLESFVDCKLKNSPKIEDSWIQPNDNVSFIAQLAIAVLELFGKQLISRNHDIPWPPRSLFLFNLQFLLEYLQSQA